MKYLIVLALVAVAAAAEDDSLTRDKRGILSYASPAVSYSSQVIHHPAPLAVAYHAPYAKYVAPLHVPKVVSPVLPYHGLAYSGLGYGHGYGYGHTYGYGHHGYGYGHGYGLYG